MNVLCRVEVFESLHTEIVVCTCVGVDNSSFADVQRLLYTLRTITDLQGGRNSSGLLWWLSMAVVVVAR
jgi:hypothetical protein